MLDQQIAKKFIGHEQEVEQFEQWLRTTDPNAPWILFFHDATDVAEKKGGVGKTWLLRKCAALAMQKDEQVVVVMVDFFRVADRDAVVIASRIVESLREACPAWRPNFFVEVLAEYQEAINQGKEELDIRGRLSIALADDLRVLDQQLGTNGKRLLVCFDTFELIEKNPEAVALNASQTFPDRYHFEHMRAVIAGRNAPDWEQPNWRGRQQEVIAVPIKPFIREEMVKFLNENCHTIEVLDPQSAQAIALHERTEGRPILVGLVTDVLNKRVGTLDELLKIPLADFESYLVVQINRLDNPINWVVLFMAHIYHRFNEQLLEWLFEHSLNIRMLVQDVQTQELSKQLLELSFVRQPGTGSDVALHDEMRRLVNKYNWRAQELPEGEYRRELSKATIGYYKHAIDHEQSERMRQIYTVEMLYHKLFIDMNEGFTFFEEHFKKAIGLWQTAFARSLLQEALHFKQFSTEQNYSMLQAEATLLRKEENSAAALRLYRKLEQEADEHWLTVHRADILFEKGQCYEQLSQFDEAIACYNDSLEIETARGNDERAASILGSLGLISRRFGELENAEGYYERSLALYKELKDQRGYADILNVMGGLYRLQGKMSEALRRCNVALRIREDLYKKGQTSEVAIGISLGTIGVIYLREDDLVNAEKFFQQTSDIFQRSNFKKGIASMYTRFGQIAMARGDLPKAMDYFIQGYRAALGIDAEGEINSLNKQARVHIQQKEWMASIPLLQRALERASDVHDVYQQAESLIDLANVYEHLGRHEEATQTLRQAEDIAQRYKYYYLLGLAAETRGENRYEASQYHEAFKYFGDYCYYMALYNPVQYEKAVRKTTDLLVKVPKEVFLVILDQLEMDWKTRDLKENSTLMLDALAEIRMLIEI